MSVTIDSLELKISHDSGEAVSALDKLIETLEKLKTATAMGGDLSVVAKGIRAIEEAANGRPQKGLEKGLKAVAEAAGDAKTSIEDVKKVAQEAMGDFVPPTFQDYTKSAHSDTYENEGKEIELQGMGDDFYRRQAAFMDLYDKGMGDLGKKYSDKQFADMFEKISEEADKAAQTVPPAVEAIKQSLDSLDESTREPLGEGAESTEGFESALDSANSKLREAYEEIEGLKESVFELDRELIEASDSVGEYDDELDELDDDLEDADEELDRHVTYVKKITHAYRGAHSGLDKFLGILKRLVIMRAIRAGIREVAQGFSEGMENLYHYSDAMDSMDAANTKNSLDTVATSLQYLKNSVGAAVAPLIQQLVPVLQTVVGWAVQAANAINMFISALQGKSIYTKAKESAVDMFDGIKSSAGGASKAAKEARATLLAFDEINRLDADTKGSGGGGGGASSSTPDYLDMFEDAVVDLPPWMQWIKDNLDDILPMVRDIGLALLAWEISNGLINGINNIVTAFQTMSALQKGISGLILIALGIKWSYEAGYAIGQGTADAIDYIKLALGALASGIGGTLLFTALGLSGPAGFAIGLSLALIATLVGVFIGSETLKDTFYKSVAGPDLNIIAGHARDIIEWSVDMKVQIDSITGEVDSSTQMKLHKAQKLILEIFDIDEKDNKTKEEMIVLKEKIAELNGLNLDGLQLEFDETTGKVKGSREEIQKMYEDVKKEYQLEAAREALKQVWQAEYDAKIKVAEAENTLKEAYKKREEAENMLIPAQERLAKAQERVNELNDKYADKLPYYKNNQQDYQDAVAELQHATDDLAVAEGQQREAIKEANKAIRESETAVWKANDAYDAASRKSEELEGIIGDLTGATQKEGEAFDTAGEKSLEYSKDAVDGYKKVQDEAKEAVKQVGSLNNVQFSSVSNRLYELKKQLAALTGKTYNISFSTPTIKGMTGYYGQGTMYASGGFPDGASYFWAGEAGPELVGTVNGRTAVASNQEITGISSAIYAMGEREVSAIENLTRALNAKNMTAVVTADSIVSGLARKNRRDGVSTVPVSV